MLPPRAQESNKAAGRPVVPLGMLVRPEATQYSLPGFKAGDWPPGSAARVAPPSWAQGKQGGGPAVAQEAGPKQQDRRPQQQNQG